MNTTRSQLKPSRRQFLGASLAATAGMLGAAAPGGMVPNPNDGNGGIKVGLYSITYLGIWYQGEALTLQQVVQRAKRYGYDGVELDGKRPHANPLDWPTAKCREFRSFAEDNGIAVYAVAANNDFSSPIPERREAEIAYVKELIRMTADFGAPVLRVFLAWSGVTRHPKLARYDIAEEIWAFTQKGFTDWQRWVWCRECLTEVARYAADHGVTLALQNHRPVIRDHHDVVRMIKEVGSPHLKACLDAPNMPDKTPASVRQAAFDVGGALQVLSHFGGEYQRERDGSIAGGHEMYPAFIRAMTELGYTGYIGYELCHTLPVVNGQTVGIEYADQCAELACEYMRGVIREARAR